MRSHRTLAPNSRKLFLSLYSPLQLSLKPKLTFPSVIYGNAGSTGSISQSLSTLVPNQSYTLTYYMRIMGAISLPTSTCVLTASIGGTVVDTLTISYSNIATYRTSYVQRTASVVATSQTDTLKFAFSCGVSGRSLVDLLLDNISMVGAGNSCGVAP